MTGVPTRDEELIRRFQQGDQEAFDLIVARFKGPLFGFLCRMIGDPAFAEDLLQETFLRLWTNKHSYREIAKFSTWLYTVAGNLAKTELRKQKLRRWIPIGGSDEEHQLEIPDQAPTPDRSYEQRTIERRVNEEIAKLPLVFREVVVLRDIQELSYEEIGSILGVPIGTVKSRVNRGRRRLQKKLGDLL